ncbi:hypothetical protein CAPTEDRAFT_197954 [Capitella teleta]|uniref:Uncharacterized protein n=1 Tax=Capitella teleta TaxID=283909 RepID=R7U9D0_CAPTE|nr:hypothetical protein CAPTEDRAFT_197954 [Capitella teleta]|eukprot:ELU02930.1 hypothetical protein CAPTEDRAFT_197954 [Capitella teleta]
MVSEAENLTKVIMESAGVARKPEPLRFTGNVADNWERFIMEFDIFVETLPAGTTERQKAMMLLNLAGQEAMLKEKSFVYAPEQPAVAAEGDNPARAEIPAESRYEVQTLKDKFQQLCDPQPQAADACSPQPPPPCASSPSLQPTPANASSALSPSSPMSTFRQQPQQQTHGIFLKFRTAFAEGKIYH